MRNVTRLTATRIAESTRSGKLTVTAVAEAFLARIASRDAAVEAWAWLDRDAVLAQAFRLDQVEMRGPLHGVPIALKDVFDTHDMPTGYGSALYAGHRPAIDAASVALLRNAGALILGKATTVEFAGMGASPPTRNPHDPARSPGGSSSGSAAAVGDWQAPLALGTQTAGSTLRPASYCGVHAIKPTWGVVSREGVRFLAPSLDTVTWFARSVEDLELLCEVFEIVDARPAAVPALQNMRIGLCRTPWWEEADPVARDLIEEAAHRLARAGARVETFDLPTQGGDLRELAGRLTREEARYSFLHEWRRHGARISAPLQRLFDQRVPDVSGLAAARDAAAAVRVAFDEIAAGYDAIIAPSATGEAPLIGAGGGLPTFNHFWTLLHAPCVNLPLFTGAAGLPIGLTVAGRRYSDRATLQAARSIESVLNAPPG